MQELRQGIKAETKFSFEDNVLEVLKRAREFQSGEGVSWNESEANVREEVIRRGVKAGTCNSEGGPVNSEKIMTMPPTKGFGDNYRRIFGHD